MLASDPAVRSRTLDRFKVLAAETGVPLTFGLVATREAGHLLDFLDDVAAAGGRAIAQTHCRGISVLLSLKTRLPFDLIDSWRELRARPVAEQVRVLRDPELRQPYVDAAVSADYGQWKGVGAQARPPDFEGIRIYRHGLPPNPTVADEGRRRGVHPAEAMIDLCASSDGDQLFIQPSLYPQDEGMLLRALRHPRAVMTFSDSGAHLSQIADSSIHTHLLGYWVRDRQEFTLEEAVRMITLAPALAWGFADRGLLRPGMVADLNVFDPATIGPAVPTLVDDLPGGGRRLEQRSHGFLATLVNGQVTVRDGALTGVSPGRLLRSSPELTRQASPHPQGRGLPAQEDPTPLVHHGVVDVADPEGQVGRAGGGIAELEHHRVAVQVRRSALLAQGDERVGDHMHALREGTGCPHGGEPFLQRQRPARRR